MISYFDEQRIWVILMPDSAAGHVQTNSLSCTNPVSIQFQTIGIGMGTPCQLAAAKQFAVLSSPTIEAPL